MNWGLPTYFAVELNLLDHSQGAGLPTSYSPASAHQPFSVGIHAGLADGRQHCVSGGDCCFLAAERYAGVLVGGRFLQGL